MSIPQICPCCSNHISEPHHPDCSFGTAEYACLGWPNYTVDINKEGRGEKVHNLTWRDDAPFQDSATAIRRLLEYLEDEPEEEEIVGEMIPNFAAITLLRKRSEDLRKEAAGMYHVEARAKRIFAADILTQIVEELQ